MPQPIYSIHQLVFSAGIDTEKGYPYDARTETCHYRKADVGATDSGYVNIPSGDEQKLKEAVATVGPVSVAIDATQPSFFNYKSGKFRLLSIMKKMRTLDSLRSEGYVALTPSNTLTH